MSNLNYTKDQLIEELFKFSFKNIKEDKIDKWKEYIIKVFKKQGFKDSKNFKILEEAERLISSLNEKKLITSNGNNFEIIKCPLKYVEKKFKRDIKLYDIPEKLHKQIINVVSEFAPRGKDFKNYIYLNEQNNEQNL